MDDICINSILIMGDLFILFVLVITIIVIYNEMTNPNGGGKSSACK